MLIHINACVIFFSPSIHWYHMGLWPFPGFSRRAEKVWATRPLGPEPSCESCESAGHRDLNGKIRMLMVDGLMNKTSIDSLVDRFMDSCALEALEIATLQATPPTVPKDFGPTLRWRSTTCWKLPVTLVVMVDSCSVMGNDHLAMGTRKGCGWSYPRDIEGHSATYLGYSQVTGVQDQLGVWTIYSQVSWLCVCVFCHVSKAVAVQSRQQLDEWYLKICREPWRIQLSTSQPLTCHLSSQAKHLGYSSPKFYNVLPVMVFGYSFLTIENNV